MNDAPLTVWGDGSTVRDYLHVDDLVALCDLVLAKDLAHRTNTFNFAGSEGIPLNVLLDAIDGPTGRPLRRDYQPARRVDVHRIVPDNSAAPAAFDWQPGTTLEQGLRQTWQWFTTQP